MYRPQLSSKIRLEGTHSTRSPNILFAPVTSTATGVKPRNLWDGYSLKSGRDTEAFDDLQYDYWISIEANPSIESHCERPVQDCSWVEGHLIKFTIDSWVRWRDGRQEFRAIRRECDVRRDARGEILDEVLRAQKQWAARCGYQFEIVTDATIRADFQWLQSWKLILHFLKVHQWTVLDANVFSAAEVAMEGCAAIELGHLISVLQKTYPGERASVAVYRLLHAGQLSADLRGRLIGRRTKLSLIK
jgi:hypothetical protein